jgi:hypothetical protein
MQYPPPPLLSPPSLAFLPSVSPLPPHPSLPVPSCSPARRSPLRLASPSLCSRSGFVSHHACCLQQNYCKNLPAVSSSEGYILALLYQYTQYTRIYLFAKICSEPDKKFPQKTVTLHLTTTTVQTLKPYTMLVEKVVRKINQICVFQNTFNSGVDV